ncbi:MAG: SdrD B-like domain-containing protein, partial [Anaerolineae bacterium]
TTAGDGSYLFLNVPPGSYIVRETDPVGFTSTTPNDVGVSVPSGGSASANFGDNLPGSVAGTVFDDIDGDGVQDSPLHETGLGGVTIGLYSSGGALLASTTTSGDGSYLFTNVAPGSYSVRETDPSGWSSTTSNNVPVTVPAGGLGHADFGDQLIASVSGVVFNDLDGDGVQDPGEPGIGGVTVQLINPSTGSVVATTVTAGDGSYIFRSVTPGAYTVRETDPTGFNSTTPNDVSVSVPAGGAAVANFGDRQVGTVSGVVFNDINGNGSQQGSEAGLAGVTVGLYDGGNNLIATTTTAGNGSYLFLNVPPGSYSVRETDPAGFLSTTPNSVNVTVPAGGSASANFGDQIIALGAASLSGVVYLDSNGNGIHDPAETVGIAGAPVTIYGPNGVIITRTTTITGFYSVTNLPPGIYTVTMPNTLNSPTAVLSSPSQLNATLASGENRTGLDFGYVLPTGFTIVSFTAQWQGDVVVVRWIAINEGALAGYHIYRSTDPDGSDLVRVTQQMVPVAGGTYQINDTTAVRGQPYWYWVQTQPDELLIGPYPMTVSSKVFIPVMRKHR